MTVDLRLSGGKVVTPSGTIEADVLVQGSTIAGLVRRGLDVGPVGRELDVAGKVVLPGMIDVHVHTREPGFETKEDITTTTQQAAVGGVTTVFGMPNLDPPTTGVKELEDVLGRYAARSIVDWNHNPAATVVEEIAPMAERGVRAFKIYMVVDTGRTYPHPAGTGMHDHGDLLRMMDTIAPTGLRFIVHPHDQAVMDYIEGGFLGRGENTPAAYAQAYAARDGVIWDTACDVIIRLSEASGCPIHIAHMQTRRSIDAVRRAKRQGVPVTCEVNHWALFLGRSTDIDRLGPYALSYWVPDDAREAVWEGIADGTIDLCSSDHAPHLREEKEIGWTRMWSAHTGTPGIQYYLPLLLDATTKGLLTVERVAELVAGAPARAFGLEDAKGAIAPGLDADLVVADLAHPWTISDDGVLSRCGWTPYHGVECEARIERTFVRGVEVAVDGEVVGRPGHGEMATSGKGRH
ncbi:MAG: dihydroorotase [Acidimicrobiales bacterium]